MSNFDCLFLLMFPATTQNKKGWAVPESKPKDAPYFYDLDIEVNLIEAWREEIDSTAIQFSSKLFDSKVISVECRYQLPNELSEENVAKKNLIQTEIKKLLHERYKLDDEVIEEEYSIVLLPEANKPFAEFVKKNDRIIAQFIRTYHKPLDQSEIDNTLISKIHYLESELTIIDWEGSFILSSGHKIEEDIELFTIGNYQILRYRMLDAQIDKSLAKLRQTLNKTGFKFINNDQANLTQVVKTQLSLLLDFENTSQSILLIGDWYSSQIYRTIVEEFYIDEWQEVVKNKLSSLSSIDETIRQNLTMSWSRFLDLVQIVGWFILLIGYFVLYWFDAGQISF